MAAREFERRQAAHAAKDQTGLHGKAHASGRRSEGRKCKLTAPSGPRIGFNLATCVNAILVRRITLINIPVLIRGSSSIDDRVLRYSSGIDVR